LADLSFMHLPVQAGVARSFGQACWPLKVPKCAWLAKQAGLSQFSFGWPSTVRASSRCSVVWPSMPSRLASHRVAKQAAASCGQVHALPKWLLLMQPLAVPVSTQALLILLATQAGLSNRRHCSLCGQVGLSQLFMPVSGQVGLSQILPVWPLTVVPKRALLILRQNRLAVHESPSVPKWAVWPGHCVPSAVWPRFTHRV
jgi:hypothetical protein